MARNRPVASRLGGFRAHLALAIALIVAASLGVAYLAIYRGTGADLQDQLRHDLAEDAGTLAQHVSGHATNSPRQVFRRATGYIRKQPSFGPTSELTVVRVPGAGTATNEPELIGAGRSGETGEPQTERRGERGEGRAIRTAPAGYSTLQLRDAGAVLLFTRILQAGGQVRATLTVGQPLAPVSRAQAGVSHTFLLAGGLALIVALAAGIAVAARTAAPLRGMARVAGAVDSGDLSHRMIPRGAEEARHLAVSFNRMLDRLEEAFVRQRAFVSDASHELRTPLTAIRGQIEVLAREADPSPREIDETAEVIGREISRMQRLIDDMLLLAHTDEERETRLEPIDVRRLLGEAAAAVAPGERGRVDVGPVADGTVRADPDRIAQVIRNLLANAIQHAGPAGSVRLSADGRNGQLILAVEDDGPGIPAAERNRVFDRFHRLDSSRSRDGGGSGLGLAIAKAIVEAHHGRMWVEDSAGGGARFCAELPGFEPAGRGGA